MAYPKDRFTAIELDPSTFWGGWQATARKKTLPSLLGMLKDTGRWEMWDLQKRGGLYDAAGEPPGAWPRRRGIALTSFGLT